MRLHEMFLTEVRHYNWTSPIILYRGSQRGISNPFSDTRLGFPTFSDVYGVSEGYGKVFRYRVKLNKPCILWEGADSEVVIEPATLQQRLRYSDEEMLNIVRGEFHGFKWYSNEFRKSGAMMTDEEILHTLHTPFEQIEAPITINAYPLAATSSIQQKAVALGYDGFILRGPYTGDMGTNAIPEDGNTSWDGITALEWMVFKPSCVKLIGEVTAAAEEKGP